MRSRLQNKPKTTKSCRVEGHHPEAWRFGCRAGAQAGDRTEPHFGPPLLRRGALAASSGHLPRGGKGVRVQHRPTHALRGAHPTMRAHARSHAGVRSDISWELGEPAPIEGREAGRITAALRLPGSAPHRGGARARLGRGGGAG